MSRFNPIHFLAFGFGSGHAPKAPGTFGTLAAIPVYWLVHDMTVISYLTLVAVMFLVGIWICHVTAHDMGVHDHPGIVWDEIVGYLVTMTAAPWAWQWLLVGFLWFRFFDILKPWPIRWFDRQVSGGLGIMLDDLVAGVFAAIALQVCIWLF